MDPVRSNLTNKACADPTGSNCVVWSGGQLCSTSICGTSTLTDVITALDNKICSTNNPDSPCYTGSWVDFSAGIPGSGTTLGVNWTISDFGFAEGGLIENVPMYKWTKDGNLSLRGSFRLRYTTSSYSGQYGIPLGTIPTNCMPPNWNASQIVLVQVGAFGFNGNKVIDVFFKADIQLIYPTGQLVLWVAYDSIPSAAINDYPITFGGVTFNLA